MTARTRLWVLVVSTPVIAFTLIGGYLGQAMTRDETIRNLRIFEDVMQLVVENYVEEVDVRKAMRGLRVGTPDMAVWTSSPTKLPHRAPLAPIGVPVAILAHGIKGAQLSPARSAAEFDRRTAHVLSDASLA